MVTWIIMSYTYPHWYSQKGERFPWHLAKTKRMSTTRHHHLDVKKTCAKPLVSVAWVKQLNSYSGSLLSLLSFYFCIRVCLKMGDTPMYGTPMYGYEAMGK